MGNVIYVGVDVHKDTNSVCLFDQQDGTILNERKLDAGFPFLDKYLKKMKKDGIVKEEAEYFIGYEAGPTGFGLCRSLQKEGYDCVVMAPTTIRKASGEKVKTDRKDARLLAATLAADAYKGVYLPDDEDEATKEFTRTRNALQGHLKKSKQQLLGFLLRMGRPYPESGNYWTEKFWEWVKTVRFKHVKLQRSLEIFILQVKDLQDKIDAMDNDIEEIADSERYKEKVGKLVCFTGIETHTALSLVCEIGDFSRFSTAEQFSSYLGLCPGQDSSGKKVQYNAITKSGNTRLRLLLIEATKGVKRSNPYNKSKRIKARQSGQSPLVIAYADKGTKRIKSKMTALESRKGKNVNVSTVAGARELSCFVWGMMTNHID
jgi:transposase